MSDLLQAIVVRPESVDDRPAVRAILEAAFPTAAEADLVDAMREEVALVLSLVAEQADARVTGYAGFSRLTIEHHGTRTPAVGLAPVAVTPDLQRRGVGTALIEDGLARLASRGETLVFVLGDPAYYGRFGFDAVAAASFSSQYAGPHFMLRRLCAGASGDGMVHYPHAFDALG